MHTCAPSTSHAGQARGARLRITLHRSLATRRLQVGNAVAAAAMAVCVSAPFMPGALAITSPVAGLTTCAAEAHG